MKIFALLSFVMSLSSFGANPVYPKSIENLKSFELNLYSLSVWNDNTWFKKSRTMYISVSYCHETDEGSNSKVWCRELEKTGSYTLTAGRNPNAVSAVAMATYKPTSEKKSKIIITPEQIKRVIALDNADGDLVHYLKVTLYATATFSTLKNSVNIGFDDPQFFSEYDQTYTKKSHHSFSVEVADDSHTFVHVSADANFK